MKAVLFSKNLEAYSQFINVCKSFFSDILFVSDSMSNIFEIRGLRHIRKNQPEYDNFIDKIYSFNGESKDSEWFPLEAKITPASGKNPAKVEAVLPPKTTHYVFNLIDENNFMVCHPKLKKDDFGGTSLRVSN